MSYKLLLIIGIISALIFSCDTSESKSKDSENISPEHKKIIFESEQDSINSIKLIERYQASIDWNKFHFTYQIQEKFENRDSAKMAIKARAIDIVKIGNSYFIKVIQQKNAVDWESLSPYKEVLLLLAISESQLVDISSKLPPEEEWSFTSENGCFIFTADSIFNNNIKFYDELTSESNTAIVSPKGVLVIKGKLIDYYIAKQLK